jgi:hypothetical protein
MVIPRHFNPEARVTGLETVIQQKLKKKDVPCEPVEGVPSAIQQQNLHTGSEKSSMQGLSPHNNFRQAPRQSYLISEKQPHKRPSYGRIRQLWCLFLLGKAQQNAPLERQKAYPMKTW